MIPGSLAVLLRYCRRSKSLGVLCTHKSGIMATENSECHLPTMPESDAIEKLEQISNSEITIEPRVPLQGDLNDKSIKAEGSDNVKDAGFEFVDYRTLIKQERSSEENPFPNTTYSSSENLMSEMERDSKDIHINTDTFKAELSDSATNTDFEAEAETVPLKAETATSSQDMKVEIETIPIIDSERECLTANRGSSATMNVSIGDSTSNKTTFATTGASTEPIGLNEINTVLTQTRSIRKILQQQPADEFKIFGMHVASQLRRLSPKQAISAQEQIQSTLTRCRLQDLRNIKEQGLINNSEPKATVASEISSQLITEI